MDNRQTSLRTLVTEDGAAILDASSGEIKTLNSTGAYIWQALRRGDDVAAIAVDLACETREDRSIVEHDVAVFVAQLREQHLWPC